jgi:hypothetical protein
MPRVFKSLYCESSGGKALRRRWAAALRAGSDEGQTALPVLRVCGELLILGKSLIRHTQVSEGYIRLSRTKIMPMVATFQTIERTSGTPKA